MTTILSNCVSVVIFSRQDAIPRYLILHRAQDKRYAGHWRLLTGKIADNETAVTSAMRELLAETALQPRNIWALDYVHAYYDHLIDTTLLIPVFVVEVTSLEEKLSAEHDNARWISYEQAFELLTWHGQREALRRADEDIVTHVDRGAAFLINSKI